MIGWLLGGYSFIRGTELQNILIVCEDKILRKDVSKVLATELNFLYVDVDEILDYELLSHQDISLIEASEALEKLERKSIERALGCDNCVISLSRDLFVSNDNFRLFDKCKKVFIELSKGYFVARYKGDKRNLEQDVALFDKINKLISVNCDIVIQKEIKSIVEIGKEIGEKLKK